MLRVTGREQFAKNLRKERKAQNLSQEALGDLAELHRTEISLLERAERDPRLETILRLARGLRIPPARLLEDLS